MLRRLMTLALVAIGVAAYAQLPSQGSGDDKQGTYLGVLFSAVPQAVYKQVPTIPQDCGVLVNFVLADSPAAKAGIQRYDILLQYDDVQIKDCDHFAELISNDSPNRTVRLKLVRAGKEETVEAKLQKGPALRVAQNTKGPDKNGDVPKGRGKPVPGGVILSVKPLEGGLVSVLFEYLDEKNGELRSVPLSHKTLKEVDAEIVKLPVSIKPSAESAWAQARERLEQKNDDKK